MLDVGLKTSVTKETGLTGPIKSHVNKNIRNLVYYSLPISNYFKSYHNSKFIRLVKKYFRVMSYKVRKLLVM